MEEGRISGQPRVDGLDQSLPRRRGEESVREPVSNLDGQAAQSGGDSGGRARELAVLGGRQGPVAELARGWEVFQELGIGERIARLPVRTAGEARAPRLSVGPEHDL